MTLPPTPRSSLSGMPAASSLPTTPVASPKMIQGALEESNVQAISEVTRMISSERDFQFVAQFVEAEGQRKQTAIDKLTAAPNV